MICLDSRAAQIFWDLIPQTPNWKLAENVKVYQVSSLPEFVLPRPQSPEDVWLTFKDGLYWLSSGLCRRGKTTSRMDLKLGIPSRFGPIFSLEFEE